MAEVSFSLSYDGGAYFSILFVALLGLAALLGPSLARRFHDWPAAAVIIVGLHGLAALGLIAVMYSWAPSRYVITDKGIEVRSPVGLRQQLAFDRVREVKSIQVQDATFAKKIHGNDGLCAYTGEFETEQFGVVRVESRRLSGQIIILVMKDGRTWALGPDYPDRFLAHVQSRTGGNGAAMPVSTSP